LAFCAWRGACTTGGWRAALLGDDLPTDDPGFGCASGAELNGATCCTAPRGAARGAEAGACGFAVPGFGACSTPDGGGVCATTGPVIRMNAARPVTENNAIRMAPACQAGAAPVKPLRPVAVRSVRVAGWFTG
jgi:hypothetical protein